ncbi:Uncharacterised protein [Mycobacteroides abscessus subsp. abscessus]|nr:Uncharacterised protein [Mycobacteroides abscessus subsp. abscessus]
MGKRRGFGVAQSIGHLPHREPIPEEFPGEGFTYFVE